MNAASAVVARCWPARCEAVVETATPATVAPTATTASAIENTCPPRVCVDQSLVPWVDQSLLFFGEFWVDWFELFEDAAELSEELFDEFDESPDPLDESDEFDEPLEPPCPEARAARGPAPARTAAASRTSPLRRGGSGRQMP
jgi:hypothetical protein